MFDEKILTLLPDISTCFGTGPETGAPYLERGGAGYKEEEGGRGGGGGVEEGGREREGKMERGGEISAFREEVW